MKVLKEKEQVAHGSTEFANASIRSNALATATINANGKGSQLLETAAGSFLGKLTSKAVDLIL